MTSYRDVHGQPHERPFDAPVEWRVIGYGIIVRAGRLLMVEPVMEAGWTWGLPGGGISCDPEDSILAGIAREVYEETGYWFDPDPAALVFAGEAPYRTLRGRYLRSLLFVVRGEVGHAPDPAWAPPEDEVKRVAWVDPDGLREADVQWHHWEILSRLGLVSRDS